MRRSVVVFVFALSVLQAWASDAPSAPLQLPPGLVQELEINPKSSYFGDALRAVDCPADEDNPFGTCGNLLFGGLAITDANLSGKVRIRFFPLPGNRARFEVTHPRGFGGELGTLSAPQFFRMPVEANLVRDPTEGIVVSEGELDLVTGEVSDLEYRFLFINTAVLALANVNPKLESPVIKFPGIYGTAWAKFEQRPDGLLDYTFYGSSFLALGNDISGDVPRFPLPFCNILVECASIPAPGTSLHPHIFLTTKVEEEVECGDNCPEIPTNSVVEMVTYTHNTSFGDAFTLKIPELGGNATGRSHLLGRIQVQFGERFGDLVPFSVSSLPPAGLLAEPPASPLSFAGLSVGLIGHDEFLRFPNKTYFLQDVAFADDPFDVSLGVLNLKTGKVLGELLYRGFIAQDLLFVLLEQNDGRIAPSSFNFRGPASFEKSPHGETIFRFNGDVRVDFSGFRFPSPDFVKANSWIAGDGSVLDPFLRIQAMLPTAPTGYVFQGGETLTASTGDRFSYSYNVPCDAVGKASSFEYTNQNPAEGGTFKMYKLASVSCTNSRGSQMPEGQYDTLTFTGFGSWSKDKDPHLATVQISRSVTQPYVSIIIDGGLVSNVNTKPERLEDSLP